MPAQAQRSMQGRLFLHTHTAFLPTNARTKSRRSSFKKGLISVSAHKAPRGSLSPEAADSASAFQRLPVAAKTGAAMMTPCREEAKQQHELQGQQVAESQAGRQEWRGASVPLTAALPRCSSQMPSAADGG